MVTLDQTDCVILEELQQQADLPNIELARRIGLSPAATLRRVQRLRTEGVITGIQARVDPDTVGLGVQAFVLATLSEHSPEADAHLTRGLASLPYVLRADAVAGADDVLLHIAAADARELQLVLRALPRLGIRRLTTLFRLEAVKPPASLPIRPTAPDHGPNRIKPRRSP